MTKEDSTTETGIIIAAERFAFGFDAETEVETSRVTRHTTFRTGLSQPDQLVDLVLTIIYANIEYLLSSVWVFAIQLPPFINPMEGLTRI